MIIFPGVCGGAPGAIYSLTPPFQTKPLHVPTPERMILLVRIALIRNIANKRGPFTHIRSQGPLAKSVLRTVMAVNTTSKSH